MSGIGLATRYLLFAVIATAINICTQWAFLRAYTGHFDIALSIGAGTATGLVTKFLLDRRWIFRFRGQTWRHEQTAATRYALTGVSTTAIFWGTEWLFHLLFANETMRYVGASIGLAIGYTIKYQMDKQYTFRQNNYFKSKNTQARS